MAGMCDTTRSGFNSRLELFERVLFGTADGRGTVDIEQLAALCIDGIPDTADGLRATCWQLLLGCLPVDRSQWANARDEGRRTYAELVHSVQKQAEHDTEAAMQLQTLGTQIRADIERTQPDISLFRQPIADSDGRARSMGAGSVRTGSSETTLNDDVLAPPQTHGDAMARVLAVYARFNRGAGYAQGMNEVLAPLYHVAAQSQGDTEADAFHMLVRALRGAHLDLFVAALDTHGGGLQGALSRWWTQRVRVADAELWERLTALGARPEHFAVRWLLVWGAREFALPDVLALWDAVIAAAGGSGSSSSDGDRRVADDLAQTRVCEPVRAMVGRIPCVVRVRRCVSGDAGDTEQLGFLFDFFTAVLLALRPRLMHASFDACLALLQGLRAADVPELREMRALVAGAVRLRQIRCETRAVRACRAVLASADCHRPPVRVPMTPTRLLRQITSRIGLAANPMSPPPSPVGSIAAVEPESAVALCVVPLPSARLGVFEPVADDESVMRLLGSCCALAPSLASVVGGGSMRVSVPARSRSVGQLPPLEPWWKRSTQQQQQQQQLLSPVSPPCVCVCVDGSCCGVQGSLRVRRRIELVDGDSDDD
ncbi:hypothetical protein H4R99_003815 [Coemansia sp. RSA 1722]|nr:hypothetical protein IWW45_001142 [Coemansia sp. RSA 485]KAJ2597936.1 hypothetical protein GGF39_002837 [Coemansia sp. RSA 1721]KAJ2599159.1 hypothetical protein H4R99_003815 [Coemansia sp. RSA 1722]